jgi:hypothetical protein
MDGFRATGEFFGKIFKVVGACTKAEKSFLKGVSGRIFKIRKCILRSKQKLFI